MLPSLRETSQMSPSVNGRPYYRVNEMFYKRRAAIGHLRDGLALLDVLKMMIKDTNVMRPLFVTLR